VSDFSLSQVSYKSKDGGKARAVVKFKNRVESYLRVCVDRVG
jgi:hypothetical protein